MSSNLGEVRFLSDGAIYFAEYGSCADIMCSELCETLTEYENRSGRWNECHCGRAEPCELATFYGPGFSWPGEACRYCRAITDGTDWEGRRHGKGLPPWWIGPRGDGRPYELPEGKR